MEVYFLKSVACLSIFLLFYKLLLEKEKMHVFKRFYLLVALLAAVAIPFITFTTYVEPSPEVFQPLALTSSEDTFEASANISNYLDIGLWIIYALGVFFFSLKFCRNIREIIVRIQGNPKVKDHNFITVLLTEKVNPHTFFSYIFLNKIKYEKQEIPKEDIIHEQAHAIQKHSLDILLVELAQIIFLFNPLLFLLKDAIKLNHEFLADDSVLKNGTDPTGYKKTLLSYSSGGFESGLVNPINYSSIKKRFTVMKTRTSKTAVWARSLLVLPLLAVLVYGFSTKRVVEKQLENSPYEIENSSTLELRVNDEGTIFLNNKKISITDIKKLDFEKYTNLSIDASPNAPKTILDQLVQIGVNSVPIKEVKVRSNGNQSLDIDNFTPGISQADSRQEKATAEMVVEYNKLALQYNSPPEGEALIKKKDYERMEYIYSLMTSEQKKNSQRFPVPSPPPPPNKSMVAEYNKLVKYYNSLPQQPPVVKQEDANKIILIYSIMTPDQKEAAEKLNFKILPPPPPPALAEDVLPAPPPPVVGVQPPPPPPPPSFKDLVADGATFYYNDKLITPEEARNLVEVQKTVNVYITSTNDEKPVVRLTDKKDKK